MLFAIHWTFGPEVRDEANARFAATGGGPPEGVKMLIDQSPQVGGLGIAWAVQWQRLAAGKSHDQAHPGTAADDAPGARAKKQTRYFFGRPA